MIKLTSTQEITPYKWLHPHDASTVSFHFPGIESSARRFTPAGLLRARVFLVVEAPLEFNDPRSLTTEMRVYVSILLSKVSRC